MEETIVIKGGNRLEGEIELQGSKNSSLPILAATVLVDGISVIENCPELTDVSAAVKILEHLGCKVFRQGTTLTVDSRFIDGCSIPDSLMREMRSSIVFLGSILGRTGQARLSSPGGCEIGLRPIDLHISSLRLMGVSVDISRGHISCTRKSYNSDTVISLSFPSVGATENIILASVLGEGRTVIHNAAREPEIRDLADFLCKCGCKVELTAQDTVIIEAVQKIHGTRHRVIPDRIVALTYLSCVGAAGGDVLIKNTDTDDYRTVLPFFEGAGCEITDKKESIRIKMNGRPKALRDIRTMPYPGFPTDAQAPLMALSCVARGSGVIVENIFEGRFKHVGELVRMGAKIRLEGRIALVEGVDSLYGTRVECPDLRGGGALVVAGLAAKGITEVCNISHIDRGYEKIEECLRGVGADIVRVNK
ncbi:MAG: UDP-N-acetylglucosamine 1-carboxyvinyltransferase [Ruminococcaceae bacterium]|nr:UDP-N-acetylglucosamine 1-carboxyvinyltransferase [Oscillospiraceae bacterium]